MVLEPRVESDAPASRSKSQQCVRSVEGDRRDAHQGRARQYSGGADGYETGERKLKKGPWDRPRSLSDHEPGCGARYAVLEALEKVALGGRDCVSVAHTSHKLADGP